MQCQLWVNCLCLCICMIYMYTLILINCFLLQVLKTQFYYGCFRARNLVCLGFPQIIMIVTNSFVYGVIFSRMIKHWDTSLCYILTRLHVSTTHISESVSAIHCASTFEFVHRHTIRGVFILFHCHQDTNLQFEIEGTVIKVTLGWLAIAVRSQFAPAKL